ncbi:T9SS type A sorting domain-containing protein [bacterium]|nr:T9SS type A sorting domain-containing protein [bacterium]
MVRIKGILIILVISVFALTSYADGFINEYPNGNSVNEIVFQGNYAWSATYGSLVRWDRRDGSYIQFTTKDGLASNNVTGIVIDDNGKLWIATTKGVNVYDGQSFTTLTTENSGLADYRILSITKSNDGTLWFGTTLGISKFDGDSWKSYSIDDIVTDHRAGGYVTDIVIDHTGKIWAVVFKYDYGIEMNTRLYLSSFDGTAWTVHNDADGTLKALQVEAIAIDNNNTVWAATRGNDVTGPVYTFDGTAWTDTGIDGVNDISVADDGTVYLARGNIFNSRNTNPSITKFDGSSFTELPLSGLFGYQPTIYSNVFPDESGTFWFVVKPGNTAYILYSYDGVNIHQHSTVGPLSFDVNEMIVDSSNTKWLATNYGLSRFDGTTWENIVFDVKPEDVAGSGLGVLANDFANMIRDIAIDKDGTIWLATYLGIRKIDSTGETLYNTWNSEELPGMPGGVNQVVIDNNGVKWFAGNYWLYRYDGESWSTVQFGKLEGVVRSMEVDHNNVLWFGIGFADGVKVKSGVASFDGTTWTYYDIDNSPLKGDLARIAIAADNTKWIATSEGYYKFDGTTWTSYEDIKNASYPQYQPYDILIDKDGIVWFMVSGCLHSFDGSVWDDHGKKSFGVPCQFVIDNTDEVWVVSKNAAGYMASFNKNAIRTDVAARDEIPSAIAIKGNYPNPFNPSTTIEFTLTESGRAQLDIYNTAGQKVRTLLTETMMPGVYSAFWNGCDEYGKAVSSGVYFSRITMNGRSAAGRMLLMK